MRYLIAAPAGALLALALSLITTPALAFPGSMSASDGDGISGDAAFGAGVSWKYEAISSVDTLDATDYFIDLDASGGDFALTLPAASSKSGRAYVLFVSGASGTITLTPGGGDTIEGAGTLALDTQFKVFDVYSDGVSDWAVQEENGSFSGDLNGNDLSDSSDNLVKVTDPMEIQGEVFVNTTDTFSLSAKHGASTTFAGIKGFGGSSAASTLWRVTGQWSTNSDSVYDLGEPSKQWATLYIDDIQNATSGAVLIPDADGLAVTAGPIKLSSQDLECTVANTCSVGSSGARFNSVYASDLISDRISARGVGVPAKITEPDGLEVTGPATFLSTLQVNDVISHKEGSVPTPTTDYGTFFTETGSNILSWFDPDGGLHEIGGVSAAYTSMWFHGAAVTTTIATSDTLTKIVHFENVGIEARLVADPTTDDDITIPAGLDGDYLITIEASVTPNSGNNQEILVIPAITLATPLVITDATNATPIVVTSVGHGLLNGDAVQIVGVGGNTAANGNFNVSNKGNDTFELEDLDHVDVAGNGAYTSGGTVTIIYMGAATIETQVSSSDLSRATSSGTHSLAAADTISAYVANNTSANEIDFEQLNLAVVKISD